MKEKFKQAMRWMNHLCDNVMRQDGMKHFIISVMLTSVLKLFMPLLFVLMLMTTLIVMKEVVYDFKMKQGTPELRDLIWGSVGMLIGFL